MTLIKTYEPGEFVAGSTVKFTKSLPDYPATEWALTFHLRGPASLDVTATAAGCDHEVTMAATESVLEPGRYYWQTWVAKGGERFMVGSGELQVKPGLNQRIESFDGRGPVKRVLDAIDATIEGRATSDQHMYMIGNRQLMHIPIEGLLSLRTRYAQLYARELRAARLKDGAPFFKNIHTRFTRPL